jgi:hypothetical protein
MVVRTDDHGHTVPFTVGTTTDIPAGVQAGSRVTVHYHAVGSDRQMADRVVLLAPAGPRALGDARNGSPASGITQASGTSQPPAAAPASGNPQAPAESPSPGLSNQPDMELPRTASPIPLLGLVGLAAFLASAGLRALERR